MMISDIARSIKEAASSFFNIKSTNNTDPTIQLAQAYLTLFASHERAPQVFSRIDGKLINDQSAYSDMTMCARLIEEVRNIEAPETKEVVQNLQRYYFGQKYRCRPLEKKDPIDISLLQRLSKAVRNWKDQNELMEGEEITGREVKVLAELSEYSEFAEWLLENEEMQSQFFRWGLRYRCPTDIYVRYPSIQKLLTKSTLDKRVGRVGAETLLKLDYHHLSDKETQLIPTLLMEGRAESLLDEYRTISFKGNYDMSLNSIYEMFGNRSKETGNLEVLADGIMNWNSYYLGSWNPSTESFDVVDSLKENWWEELPRFELLDTDTVAERYEIEPNGTDWIVAAKATRKSKSKNVYGQHGWLEVLIPKNEGYEVFPIGKYPWDYPQTELGKFDFLCNTVPATISYPDENVYYLHREEGTLSFSYSPEEGKELMTAIGKDIVEGRQHKQHFQFLGDNCADWAWNKMNDARKEEKLPRFYEISIYDTEVEGVAGKILEGIKKLPHFSWDTLLNLACTVMGAGRTFEGVSVKSNPRYWTNKMADFPCVLFLYKEKMKEMA
ncbi:MAG: hypothetical protein CMO81_09565 [Waddliaceae bacterium]|nr:hypothetical protein [Waddliaceae bacterium]